MIEVHPVEFLVTLSQCYEPTCKKSTIGGIRRAVTVSGHRYHFDCCSWEHEAKLLSEIMEQQRGFSNRETQRTEAIQKEAIIPKRTWVRAGLAS